MTATTPAYLDVSPQRLGAGTPVRVRVLSDMPSIARDMAEVMFEDIARANAVYEFTRNDFAQRTGGSGR